MCKQILVELVTKKVAATMVSTRKMHTFLSQFSHDYLSSYSCPVDGTTLVATVTLLCPNCLIPDVFFFLDSEIIDITGDAEEQSDHTDYLDGGSAARRFKNTIHLWEFLLELLADESCRPIITWSRKLHGEFKIKRPQQVASHWGKLKHRPAMNYEKLSRALRHYYSKGIIRKVCTVTTLFD